LQWKHRILNRKLLFLCLIVLGLLLCLVPPHFWVTGMLLAFLGGFALLLPMLPSKTLQRVLALIVSLGIVVLEILVSLIAVWGTPDADVKDCSAAIVLGAQVNRETPSRILRERLDAALAFSASNPNAYLILSGGQGSGEAIPESEAMYRYLLSRGVAEERMIQENQATDTYENLRFSVRLAKEAEIDCSRFCLITSEFHCCRASYLASAQNLSAAVYPAHTGLWFFKMNYYLREVPAFIKAILQSRANHPVP